MSTPWTFQRLCAWSGVICFVLFFGAFVCAGFVPPLSPSLSAAEVAEHYRTHTFGVRAGVGLMLLSGMFYVAYTGVISAQIRRIPGVHPAVFYVQMVAGALASVTFLVPAMFFAVTAFRPERAPETTQMLNDMSWIFLVMPWPPFMTQNFAFAFGILGDRSHRPVFPRWLAYLNIWAPIIFTPGIVLQFFHSGPLAWNGIFVLWIPASIFVVQFVANCAMLLKAITAEAEIAAENRPAAAERLPA